MKAIFDVLKDNLSKYSEKYGEEIRQNKEKRAKFNQICNRIGIDPIVSKKSMWGKFSDFYNQLSVQILRICEKQREYNGGLMKVDEIVSIFNRSYPSNQITKDDVFKSVETLSKLGTGCQIVNNQYVSTVPFDLSQDQVILIKMAEKNGYVSRNLASEQGWDHGRFDLSIVGWLLPRNNLHRTASCGWTDKPRTAYQDITSQIINSLRNCGNLISMMMGTDTFNNALGADAQVHETVRLEERGDQHGESGDGEYDVPELNYDDLKFSIKSSDMSENLILFIVEKTILAFEVSRNQIFESASNKMQEDRNTLISRYIKSELDGHYGATWHVISGENYGSFFTHLKSHFAVFTFEGKWITIFKSG